MAAEDVRHLQRGPHVPDSVGRDHLNRELIERAPIPLKTGDPHDESSSPADDRRYDDPQSLIVDATILHLRDREVQPAFWLFAGPAKLRTGPGLPAASHQSEALLVAH